MDVPEARRDVEKTGELVSKKLMAMMSLQADIDALLRDQHPTPFGSKHSQYASIEALQRWVAVTAIQFVLFEPEDRVKGNDLAYDCANQLLRMTTRMTPGAAMTTSGRGANWTQALSEDVADLADFVQEAYGIVARLSDDLDALSTRISESKPLTYGEYFDLAWQKHRDELRAMLAEVIADGRGSEAHSRYEERFRAIEEACRKYAREQLEKHTRAAANQQTALAAEQNQRIGQSIEDLFSLLDSLHESYQARHQLLLGHRNVQGDITRTQVAIDVVNEVADRINPLALAEQTVEAAGLVGVAIDEPTTESIALAAGAGLLTAFAWATLLGPIGDAVPAGGPMRSRTARQRRGGPGSRGGAGQSAGKSLENLAAPRGVPTPQVADPKLNNLVNDLYKGAKGPNPIGTGSTADAVRNELRTDLPTHGRFRSQKAQEYINALTKWLRNNPNASHHDRLVAQSLLDDLKAALGGN